PTIVAGGNVARNHMRFRVSPEVTIALGATVMGWDEQKPNESVEIIASRHPTPNEMDAYERVLGDAMAGDATLFAREDYVEEAWRIVDPVLQEGTPVYEYDTGAWGPVEEYRRITPADGWNDPVVK